MAFTASEPGFASGFVDEPAPAGDPAPSAPGYASGVVGEPETQVGPSAPGYASGVVGEPTRVVRWTWDGGVKKPLVLKSGANWWENRQVTAGAVPVGSAAYPIPETGQVIYVSVSGSDANDGGPGSPKASIGAALAVAGNNATIVVGAGTYHESVTMPGSRSGITLQNMPGEAVWLDGSTVWSSGWSGTGPWTHAIQDWDEVGGVDRFDAWNPLAKWREMLLYNGAWMTQIADGATPAAGQFSVNRDTNTVTVGSNPLTGEVRNVDLARAMLISTTGATVRGIGMRRYSPSDMESTVYACVQIAGNATGTTLENVVIADCRLNGLGSLRKNVTVRDCTIDRMGKNGAGFTTADGLVWERNLVRDINRMSWKAAPTNAGIKITRTIGFTMRDSTFTDAPDASAVWTDVSVSRFTLSNLDISNSKAYSAGAIGVTIELSGGGYWSGVQYRSYVTNCRIWSPNSRMKTCVQIWNSDYVTVANCRMWGYTYEAFRVIQDGRHNNTSEATGQFEQLPWLTKHNVLINNDVHEIGSTGPRYQIYANCATDADPTEGEEIPGGEMFDRVAGNWFGPTGSTTTFVLSTATGTNRGFSTLAGMYAATGVGDLTGRFGTNHQQTTQPDHTTADPVGAELAALTAGVPATLRHIGPYLPAPTLA